MLHIILRILTSDCVPLPVKFSVDLFKWNCIAFSIALHPHHDDDIYRMEME
jgi:hypothetical protein